MDKPGDRPRALPRGGQSSAYLTQAASALTDAGDPRALWVDAPQYYDGSMLAPAQRTLTARNRRLALLRSSVLFSALAAEAYANEFLDAALSKADAAAADRLRTPDKLLLGPRLAGIEAPLERGREPLQTIAKLFVVRNALVHPRRDGPSAYLQDVRESDTDRIGPTLCGRYLLAVAQTIVLLEEVLKDAGHIRISMAGEASYLTRHPQVVDEHITVIGADLMDLPPEGGPTPIDLIEQARRRAMPHGLQLKPKPT